MTAVLAIGSDFAMATRQKLVQANDAFFALLGFRPGELIEQSPSCIISPAETRAFLAALREVVDRVAARAFRGSAYDFMQEPLDWDFFVASLYRAIRAHARIRRLNDRQVALRRGATKLEWIAERPRRELRRGPVRAKS